MRRSTLAPALLVPVLVALSLPAWGRDLPNFDATGSTPRASPAPASSAVSATRPGTVGHRDPERGVPTLVWADPARRPGVASARALVGPGRADLAARAHLTDYAAHWGLSEQDVADLEVRHVHDTGSGAVVVQFQRRVGSLLVWRETLSVVLDRNHAPVAFSGVMRPARAAETQAAMSTFRLDHRAAVASAYRDLTGAADVSFASSGEARGDYLYFQLVSPTSAPEVLVTPARAKQVLFRGMKGLQPAYYLELQTREQSTGKTHAYAYVVSARDGSLLVRTNLTQSDAFTYRVWADASGQFRPYDSPRGTSGTPHPTGTQTTFVPPYVASNLVTLNAGPISTNDPWLPAGATDTRGNNVDAFTDTIPPDGFTGTNPDGGIPDLRASTTSPGTFDHAYDTSITAQANLTQIQAAVTQLFFTNNWLHDWYYDVGFDEAAGNAQESNLGRTAPALEGDVLLAQADDFSGTNNANMSTPADGASPRMQMYIFNGPGTASVRVNSPASLAGSYSVGVGDFGPQSFSLTGDVALVNDGTGTTSDGCEGGYSGVAGKVALVDRGSCTFVLKAHNAEAAGAIGLLIANNTSGLLNMAGDGSTVTIPVMLVTQDLGASVKAQLAGGVNVTMARTGINFDGALDNTVVAHEWGHYIAHRLVGGGDGFNAQITNGMGEGWSDFHSLLLIVRPEDAAAPGFPGFSGTYALAQYDTADGYFGIRRYPYSTNMAKNPLTFVHIEDRVALPAGVPVAFEGDNTEVHNTGEVWASMLWECYAALLNDSRHTFQQAQDLMRRYLVAAYKATPANPTFTEARDAVLAVVLANDPADYQLFGKAFAKRGLGPTAVAPSRWDETNGTSPGSSLVESFSWAMNVKSAAVVETKSCDSDGILDSEESGKLVVTLQNKSTDPVNNITVTVSTPTTGVVLGNGGVAQVASLPAGQEVQAEVPITLGKLTGIQMMPLNVSITSPDVPATTARPLTLALLVEVNADTIPASSATDSVETASTVWTTASVPLVHGSPDTAWVRVPAPGILDGRQHEWVAPDRATTADESLVSPPLAVNSTGNFTVSFKARWAEEDDGAGNYYDGVVVEISDDNGTTWKDVTDAGGTLSPGYNHTLFIDATEPVDYVNPLQGRRAFAGTNQGGGTFDTMTLSFGTSHAGKTVLLRFRAGSDIGVGARGFELDDIAFTGIAGTPFATLVPDRRLCTASNTPPPSSGCSTTGGGQATLFALLALALFARLVARRGNRHA
jgi:hypothetical protein